MPMMDWRTVPFTFISSAGISGVEPALWLATQRAAMRTPSGSQKDPVLPNPAITKKVENGIGSAWELEYETPAGFDANADQDKIEFDESAKREENPGDNLNNFMEYRGIVYMVGGTLVHRRLNPLHNDLFIHHIGYDPRGVSSLRHRSAALEDIGIDVHIINGLGHDATVDGSFYVYYSSGSTETVTIDPDINSWRPVPIPIGRPPGPKTNGN